MFQPISFFIGLRYSRSRNRSGFVSFITFFSIAGILLGVASLITVVSVMNGFEGELKKRILGLIPHVVISSDKQQSFDWQTQRQQLLAQPHVLDVTPFLESEALITSTRSLQAVMLQGIVPSYEHNNIIASQMVAGSLESLSQQKYQIIIGHALARKLDVNIGEAVRIVLPNKMVFTPMGRIPVQRTFTVSGIFNVGSQVDDAMVYVHSNDAAKLMRRRDDGIRQLRVFLDDAFYAQQFVESIDFSAENLTASTWSESQGALFSAVKMEKNMMWLMLSLIIAVAAFNIVSALVMVVIDKQGEIGILQTLGMSRSDIMKIFMTQGMANGVWGVALGTVLGLVLALNLNEIMMFLGVSILGNGYASQALPIQLTANDVVVIVFSALLMSFLATIYPSYRASKTLPAEVLRNE
ncbi:lipoprotein-releasing ABC transporter permease subunit [Thalassotalea sp. PLHSN55]|uniref:lipoprotein-releasing ABC transporter permease subunit n=1 Tax=Thalassotalea sp. PLHSN55 TaxID=3435888 RepID=UPI003F82FAAC